MDYSSATEEERAMEVEALLAIYEDDLKIIPAEEDEKTVSFGTELKDIGAVLTLTVSDKYPRCLPTISVQKCGKNVVDLEDFLKTTSESLRGEVMIHSLIEEANKWARERKEEFDLRKEEAATSAATTSLCKFFLEGRCRFGDRCLNSHQLAEQTPQYEEKSQEKSARESENNKATKKSTNTSNIKEERSTKKAPMKTATDVISRIQWDDKLDPKDFIIGYLDRFTGIVEKKFTDFSWEDIASVDYDVLSIPKHRIQYFKYNGDIVWDKRERIDKVFGSTGSGCTILEVIEDGNKRKDKKEECEEKEGNENEWEVEDVDTCEVVSSSKRNDSGPNYFVALKVQEAGVLEKVEKLHKDLLLREKGMSEGIIAPQNLHVTLLVLTIKNEDQLNLAKDVLKGLHHVLPSTLPPSAKLKFKGTGFFSDRVLYVNVEKEPSFEKFVEILRRQLRKVGVNLDGNREIFSPHITVARAPSTSKMSRATSREVFSSLESAYRDVEFGNQGICEIGLFSRFEPKESDGFHKSVVTLKNSFLSVLPTLENKIVKYIEDVCDSEKIGVDLKQKVTACIESKIPLEIDEAFSALDAALRKDPRNLVVILRGIPGSGKTYLVENSSENNKLPYLTICSPKQLFYRAGNTKMNQSEMNIAEAYCRNGFLEALTSGTSLIVVDDCHAQTWQYAFYRKLAGVFGFSVRVLEIHVSDRDGIMECLKHGESGTNMEELMEMVREWEEDPNALRIEPWFRNPSLRDSIILRDLVQSP